MQFIQLIKLELLKTRRSLSLLMLMLCPLTVVTLQTLVLVKTGGSVIDQKGWSVLWMGANSIWSYFMLPLFIALITALLNGNEHKNATWRLMLTLPVQRHSLYLAKALLAWLYVVAANIMLFVWVALSVLVLNLLGMGSEQNSVFSALEYPAVEQTVKTAIACLPILMIQHLISWRFGNIVLPLAVGVIATMGIIQVGSSEYWVYYPWTYITMANMGSDIANQQQALVISSLMALLILMISTIWTSRREVHS